MNGFGRLGRLKAPALVVVLATTLLATACASAVTDPTSAMAPVAAGQVSPTAQSGSASVSTAPPADTPSSDSAMSTCAHTPVGAVPATAVGIARWALCCPPAEIDGSSPDVASCAPPVFMNGKPSGADLGRVYVLTFPSNAELMHSIDSGSYAMGTSPDPAGLIYGRTWLLVYTGIGEYAWRLLKNAAHVLGPYTATPLPGMSLGV
jgi:hypothetical protein